MKKLKIGDDRKTFLGYGTKFSLALVETKDIPYSIKNRFDFDYSIPNEILWDAICHE
jgi:hypothetical protein